MNNQFNDIDLIIPSFEHDFIYPMPIKVSKRLRKAGIQIKNRLFMPPVYIPMGTNDCSFGDAIHPTVKAMEEFAASLRDIILSA